MILWSYYFLSPRRLLTVAPHKIITNLWLAYTVFDALMHCGIASKIAHVLFFDACVKSHAFLRTLSERSHRITCVAFIFFDACVNRMRLFATKKSQRILSECTLRVHSDRMRCDFFAAKNRIESYACVRNWKNATQRCKLSLRFYVKNLITSWPKILWYLCIAYRSKANAICVY